MFSILNLRGNAFQRGYAHGTQARAQVAGSVASYKTLFAHCDIDWSTALRRAARYRELIEGCGDLVEEIDGIAKGSGFQFNEILALNCRTEILPGSWSSFDPATHAATQHGLTECTSFAVDGTRCADGYTRIAQNWDWVTAQRNNTVILRVIHDDSVTWPDYLTITEAGILAKIGVNEHGVAVGLNILRSQNDRSQLGIPVHIFQRLALDCRSVDAVVELATSLRFAASSNVVLGDATGNIACVEFSPNGAALIESDQGVVAHTNHFCDLHLAEQQAPLDTLPTTEARLARANAHITGWPDRVTTINLTTLLRDESGGSKSNDGGALGAICRKPDLALPETTRVESVFGIIINCNQREMLIAPDLPSKVEFQSVALYETA
jgi:isopenicillin-N N-acyltransferase like protein